MDFKKHLETAWNLTLKFILPLAIMTVVALVASVLTFGILAPVTMAGYMHSVLLVVREGREPKPQDVFSHMRLFLPLLGFSIIVFIATMIGFMLLVLPGILVILAVLFACLYMLPLMTDKRLGLIDAIKESYAMARQGNIADHIIVLVIFIAISSIGGSVLIGSLLTQPFVTVFLMSVYEEKQKEKENTV